MGIRGSFSGVNGRGVKLITHLQLVFQVNKIGIYTYTPPYAFME
jgi:hypothetical protein